MGCLIIDYLVGVSFKKQYLHYYPIMTNFQDNKRIAKNTLLLYFRMFFTILVGLYTSRIVLAVLDVEDYGIYNVVGGVVAMFGFLNSAMIAFSGATHDIATDGVYMTELSKSDQAKYIGWQGAFYNIAKIVASGGLVYLAGWLVKRFGGVEGASGEVVYEANVHAWMIVMFVMAIVMISLGLYHTRMLPSGGAATSEATSFKETFDKLVEVILDFFKKKHIWYYIAFIILYRFAEGFVMKIVPLFLKAGREIGGLGLSEQEIGIYYGTYGAAAFVLGSLLAGYYISHRGLKKTLFSLCCTFNLPFIAYTLLAIYQPTSGMLIGGAIVLEYFGYGFGFVGLTLFMMQQVAPGKHQMAHYAFASGIMNLGVMLPGMVSGFVSDWLGYRDFFIFILFATIPAFLITYFVPFTYPDTKK